MVSRSECACAAARVSVEARWPRASRVGLSGTGCGAGAGSRRSGSGCELFLPAASARSATTAFELALPVRASLPTCSSRPAGGRRASSAGGRRVSSAGRSRASSAGGRRVSSAGGRRTSSAGGRRTSWAMSRKSASSSSSTCRDKELRLPLTVPGGIANPWGDTGSISSASASYSIRISVLAAADDRGRRLIV